MSEDGRVSVQDPVLSYGVQPALFPKGAWELGISSGGFIFGEYRRSLSQSQVSYGYREMCLA